MKKITDPKDIVKFFNDHVAWKGHFNCRMPDGTEDDYDNSVPDYAAKQYWKGTSIDCWDSNGSSPSIANLIDDKAVFTVSACERCYEIDDKNGVGWCEASIRCVIESLEVDPDEDEDDAIRVVVIESAEITYIQGSP